MIWLVLICVCLSLFVSNYSPVKHPGCLSRVNLELAAYEFDEVAGVGEGRDAVVLGQFADDDRVGAVFIGRRGVDAEVAGGGAGIAAPGKDGVGAELSRGLRHHGQTE